VQRCAVGLASQLPNCDGAASWSLVAGHGHCQTLHVTFKQLMGVCRALSLLLALTALVQLEGANAELVGHWRCRCPPAADTVACACTVCAAASMDSVGSEA
jgi:hypothetical protein